MTPREWALALWGVFLVLAIPYVARAKHPRAKPVAAYLLFVVVFSAATVVLFLALAWLAEAVGLANVLAGPAGMAVYLALVFVLAFLLARWQIRKPPLERPPPE